MDMPKHRADADTRREDIIDLAQEMANAIPSGASADTIAYATAAVLNRAYLPYGMSVQITLIPTISGGFSE